MLRSAAAVGSSKGTTTATVCRMPSEFDCSPYAACRFAGLYPAGAVAAAAAPGRGAAGRVVLTSALQPATPGVTGAGHAYPVPAANVEPDPAGADGNAARLLAACADGSARPGPARLMPSNTPATAARPTRRITVLSIKVPPAVWPLRPVGCGGSGCRNGRPGQMGGKPPPASPPRVVVDEAEDLIDEPHPGTGLAGTPAESPLCPFDRVRRVRDVAEIQLIIRISIEL